MGDPVMGGGVSPRRSVMVKSSKQLRPVLWVEMLTWVGDRLSNVSVPKYYVETELLVLFLKLTPFQVYQRKLFAKIIIRMEPQPERAW